ncbi:hypothetical protein BPTFM16_01182 [Altererythrobacter insulae]|nr:hypothetical protein BPTFM16_01182 [Altererythrobacter insulae]
MVARLLALALVFTGLAATSTAAKADWYEASSEHFVIYADDSEKDVRRFAENLEKFHSAMEYVTGYRTETPSPSSRVTIYVVGNQRAVKKLAGGEKRNVAGFYIPRAGGSVAFVQDIRLKNGYPDFSTVVLLHEYAHHFLISNSRYGMPQWMNEGAAEFFAAASFNKDGSVQVGRPALHRAAELAYSVDVSVEELLDYDLYLANKGRRHDAFYGRSWLLYHYLVFSEERRGQMRAYQTALANGNEPVAAASDAFGDTKALGRELDAYARQRRMFNLVLGPDKISFGDVAVRPLTEGEEEVMPLIMRSKRGVTPEQAKELLPEVQAVAAEFPNDAVVLSALAEAEYDAGNLDAAIDVANRALDINPGSKNALVQKGYALFAKARDADNQDAAFNAAMRPFSALNALENDHPLPLMYYYRSYVERGEAPSENARHAIERASQLAPFDHTLAMNVATMQAREGKIEIASRTLAPVATAPHGGRRAAFAKSFRAALAKAEEGEPFRFNAMLTEQVVVDGPDDGSGGE